MSNDLSATKTSTFTPNPASNLGPLTTTFTPPVGCSVPVIAQITWSPFSAWLAQSCYSATYATNLIPCRPQATIPAHPSNGWGYYSPGLICPAGWTSACSAASSMSSNFNFQYPPTGIETAAGCCPSGFKCTYYAGNEACVSLARETTMQGIFCDDAKSEYTQLTVPATALGSLNIQGTVDTVTIYAPLIQLVYKATDLLTSNTVSSNSFNSFHNTNTASLTSSHSPTSESASSGGGISKGGIAGVVVGTIAALALLITGTILLRSFRKRRRHTSAAQGGNSWEKPELPGEGISTDLSPRSQLDTTRGLQGLNASTPQELDATRLQELDSTHIQR